MSGVKAERIPLENWCPGKPYRTARQAILSLDLTVEDNPGNALAILNSAWTAITVLCVGGGIPAPRLYAAMGWFCKLNADDLTRVREAVEMRMNALQRAAGEAS